MLHCNSLIASRLVQLMERFPDRVHSGLAPTPPPAGAAFCLMHCAARAGDLEVLSPLMALERLMGQHCSLLAKGEHKNTWQHGACWEGCGKGCGKGVTCGRGQLRGENHLGAD